MKKFFSVMVVAAAFAFVGCGNANQPAAEAEVVAEEAVEVVEAAEECTEAECAECENAEACAEAPAAEEVVAEVAE